MAKRGQQVRPVEPLEEPGVVSERVVSQRRVLGVLCALYWVVALVALLTYDWRDISWLCNPPSPPDGLVMNRVGKLGAWLTFYGYGLAGLAYRYAAFPLLALLTGFLLHGRVRFFRLRVLWMAGLYVTLACLFQVCGGDTGATIPLLADLNLRPNAGGALGQWIVTTHLRPLLGTFGLQLLLWALTLVFTLLIVGVRNTLLLLVRLTMPREPQSEPGAEDEATRALLARNSGRAAPEPGSDEPKTLRGFVTALFRRKAEAAAETLDPRDLLSRRAAPEPDGGADWSASAYAPRQEVEAQLSLGERPNAPEPQPAPPPPSAPTPVPAPAPEPPFALSGDSPSALKPVSPLKAVTGPAIAANDNDLPPEPEVPDYTMPSTELLDPIPPRAKDADDLQMAIAAIESVFQQFGIAAQVVGQIRGPVLTLFEVMPAPGVKLERFKTYESNLLMALRAESIRIQAPIPGRDVVGIEVPNTVRQSVTLREVLEGDAWRQAERKMALPLALGKLATGGDLIVDLAEMPHLLVAGGTGSGKSVAVNDMLVGLLMCRRPDQLRLIMVDPKRVEFTAYDDLPHLLNPVVVEPKKVVFVLRWAVMEMNRRYKLLQRYGVRNISDYNRRAEAPLPDRENPTQCLPYIVIIIDELADLMLDVKSDIEPPITSLTQKARAAGLHLIIATQRPTTNVITGTIKANIPGRIALRVTQGNDSRTILDEVGAENLIGKGDMLLARGGRAPERSQAAWVSDGEIARICNFIKDQAGPAFDHVLADTIDRIKEDKPQDDVSSLISEFVSDAPGTLDDAAINLGPEDDKSDEGFYQRALEYIRQTGRFSTSALQRRLKIGYNKAGRITDMLEERGIIGPGGKAGGSREILVDLNAIAQRELEESLEPEAVPAEATPEAPAPQDFTYEPTDEALPADADIPDLGDFDPASLDAPER
ncbi:MAG: DNA translocase FtsK 4TM domain-containing protein [Candidatus Spyradenecus sp.]